ncbi:MAG TPA: proton-conducting transporter membrane subunit [Lentimicrobium sp.]|nr:proton-conducting transporter membrane subunit [Lentimicrobium sp.]
MDGLTTIFNLLPIAGLLVFPFLKTKGRGILTFSIIALQALITAWICVTVFTYGPVEFIYPGSIITGVIPVRIDYLSAWFILTISLTFFAGTWYGLKYMKAYIDQTANLTMHAIAMMLAYTSLIDICIVQNGLMFLVLWEIMALSSFILIIFEHYKTQTLKAGINFLIQSHISILFLTIGVLMLRDKTSTFDLQAVTAYTYSQPAIAGIGLFIFFFCGFAIKAGFVPFHTWLPLAHPAAPSHVSGIMSGVIIKIGIYGILRMIMLIKTDMVSIGYFILTISVISGVYGVMLAIIQHNLKKLLAYHSIENIGIIGMGIGLGCLGMGYSNNFLTIAGFGGALLHTLNHSLFKSLLFYTAGNVYQKTHTMQIERLGGIIKKMPYTAYLFLIGSLAICGLPPFNGFVSEFFIYSGLFNGLMSDNFGMITFILFMILGLVLIGGLALICFTKAFGIVFLGTLRNIKHDIEEPEKGGYNMPLYIVASFILLIGIFPGVLSSALSKSTGLFLPGNYNITSGGDSTHQIAGIFETLTLVGRYSLAFIALTAVLYYIRHLVISKRLQATHVTWGCGYTGDVSRMQYTASSYIRTYRKLAEPVFLIKKDKKEATGLHPKSLSQQTHPYDKLEHWLIDKPLNLIRRLLNRFTFLQNGNIQAYILYGFIFIGVAVVLPLIIEKVILLINFLNQL